MVKSHSIEMETSSDKEQILHYTPLAGKSPQEAFAQGNYVGVALTRQTDIWQTYASLGLIGKTREAVDGLEKFNCKEATFYQGVAHWIGGEDDKAINCLEMVDTEHARRLLALIKKDRIKILAQLPRARNNSSNFINIQNPDPKFDLKNISFHADDLANQPYADIKSYLNADDPPDFYICKMIEWHVIPPNIQDLPCPIFGHTGDYDLHIQAVYPWLQLFDEMLVTDHTEYSDVSKLVRAPVCTFPKSFGILEDLPEPDIVNRSIDGFLSGSTLHPFHPDKIPPLLEMLSLPLEQQVYFFDGFMFVAPYYGLLANAKTTFTFVRHPGAMPTRGLEALSMGMAIAVQEGSSLSIFAGKNEGVLTYRPDGKGLKQVLEQIIENWPEFQIQAQRGMEMIRRDFALSKVASQYYRFLTFLAAKPRPERIKVCANDLKQKRMIISKGWLPGDSSVMKKLLAANFKNWEKQGRDNFSAGDYIDLARELVLQFTAEKNLNPTRDPRKPTPSQTMIRKAMSVFLEGYQRYPDSLPLIFNMLRTAFHFGTPQEVTDAIRLCRQTLDMLEGHWNVDVLEDVFPWDFNSSLFNYRTYFERVNQFLYRKERIGQGLSKLIYASLYSYLSVYENPLKNARLAVQLDPVFCFYKYRLAQLLVAQDKKNDRNEAVCLLTELSHNSILFYDALQLLEKLKRQGKTKTNDMETSCYYSDRMERSNAFAQMNQLVVRNAPWRKAELQKPESRVYLSQENIPVGNAFCVRDIGQNTTLQQRIGILIPTLDRPDFLKRTLQYYHHIRFQGQIIVGDSSGPKNAGLNQQTVDRVKDQLDIIYRHYPNPPYLHDGMCMKSMVDLAQTPYVVYSGDDDFLILAGLEKCVGFLDTNPDFVAAQGVRINLCLDKKGPWGRPVSASVYTGADYLDDSSTQRLATYLRTGLSIQYYVHRIDIWKQMYRDVDQVPSRYLGPELLPCSLSAILGKKMKLDVLSVVFQKNPNQVFSWEKTSIFDLINNPLWATSADIVRKSVTADIVKSNGLDTEKAKKVFDREFWAHINSVLMAQFKLRHMENGTRPKAESEKTLQAVLHHHQFAEHLQPVIEAMVK